MNPTAVQPSRVILLSEHQHENDDEKDQTKSTTPIHDTAPCLLPAVVSTMETTANATHKPQDDDNEQEQAQDAAQSAPAIVSAPVAVPTTTAKEQHQHDDQQNEPHTFTPLRPQSGDPRHQPQRADQDREDDHAQPAVASQIFVIHPHNVAIRSDLTRNTVSSRAERAPVFSIIC
jgi:hypothetical protein